MSGIEENVGEYLQAMKESERFSRQLVAHKLLPEKTAQTISAGALGAELQQILRQIGIPSLYSHQYKAINQILADNNIIISTPTSSGKSLVYNLPVLLQACRGAKRHKALYLFPLKALAQDQHRTVCGLFAQLRHSIPDDVPPAAIYDGDTSAYRRKIIRKKPPRVLITNPDMLHRAILPYHEQWAHFFAGLRYVILDEVHTLKGVFGSHAAWLLRRLRRICSIYSVEPTFILASATIGNPIELATELTGLAFTGMTESGAKTAPKHITLLNPIDSAAGAATVLVESAMRRSLRTIVYTQSRKMTELIAIWAAQRMPKHKDLIASYRAGFLPEDRRAIEKRLSSGALLTVIATSALELGIDIGCLDICILVGYPGSIMATWQRAGRVGRAGKESLVILLGQEDALDQYFMRHPEDFFTRPVEPVTINPNNPAIARQHLICAAAEYPLKSGEDLLSTQKQSTLLCELCASGALLQSATGEQWYAARKYPQRHVHLRGGGKRFTLYRTGEDTTFGDIDGHRVYAECHPGAVYLHMAQPYLVDHLDLENHHVQLSLFAGAYYTRPLTEKTTEILEIYEQVTLPGARLFFGLLKVREQITSFLRILKGNHRVIGKTALELPAHIFETEGFWLVLPDSLKTTMDKEQLHYMGGIHAMEHAIIGLLPLFVLCDRNDIGGISFSWNQQLDASAVVIYDGYAGGMGLTRAAFQDIEALLRKTLEAVRTCRCASGCPSCVHSPKCGSGNRPIDKAACVKTLESILSPGSAPKCQHRIPLSTPPLTGTPEKDKDVLASLRFGVFDLETQKSAQEVGGWSRCHLMGISVAGLFDSREDRYVSYQEDAIDDFLEHLAAFDLVIGFNNKRFDNKVLSAYTNTSLSALPSIDLLEIIYTQLGYRLSLDRVAEHTLGVHKRGNGLLALKWYRQGRMEELIAYCLHDVKITKDLFLFAYRQQHLLFQNKAGNTVRLPVDLRRVIDQVMHGPKG
ncbi:MAG: DEAD/DEAH box helicase [Desulfobulbus propionicus]|nr:MAG: DEAD/DEAH box helicase [Desulfobulbus propionicus]